MTHPRGRVVRGRFRTWRKPRRMRPSFSIWRRPVTTDKRVRQAVARDLDRIALFREPRWPDARQGDAAAAIAVAVDALWDRRIDDQRRDLILSALWVCATTDQAALLVLEMLKIRLSLRNSA